ncbi:MAG: ABC transporter substrate-binding protein [Bacteroidota bacterium]
MKYLIGIDDTDNKDSRGTGYRARMMAGRLHEHGFAEVLSITRHQLFFHPDIPYTSQNSSACLEAESTDADLLHSFCRDFLLADCAPGSDAGLCIIPEESVNEEIISFGHNAKSIILKQSDAVALARKHNILLEGLTGTKDGVIGALAGCGLRKSGNDGRCIWLKGKELRDFNGIYTAGELLSMINVDIITDMHGKHVAKHDRIFTDNWLRPVIKNNKITIIATEETCKTHEWRIATKEYIKSISD